MYKRGEVRWADLNPPHGTEPGKRRPVLIIQCQELLDSRHPSTLVLPLTTKLVDDAEPLRIRLTPPQGTLRDSDVLIDQARAIDNDRLKSGPLFQVPAATMRRVEVALMEVLGIET